MIVKDTTVAIIAGGKSSRYGEPKSWAMFREKRLIDYAIDLGRQLSDKIFIVNGKTLDYSHLGITTIEDEISECGPIGGLHIALKKASTEKIIIMPVDMPYLNKQVYEKLLINADKNRPIIACSHNGIEPLVSVWYKENLSVINSFIDNNQFSLRKPIEALNGISVDLPTIMDNYVSEYFININYKKDLEKIIQIKQAS